MAHLIDLQRVEDITGHKFRTPDRLKEALTAPVHLQDPDTKQTIYREDGNRCLAQLGQKLMELVLTDTWYEAGADRDKIASATAHLTNNEYLINIARRTGLDVCIVFCERQKDQMPPPKTMKLTVAAIIGAVWLDTDRSLGIVKDVMNRLGQVQFSMR